MIFKFTLQHDHGIRKLTIYGHSSVESAKQLVLNTERCLERSILKIEDLSINKTTLKTI
jgi:hypothetical protein